MGETSCGGGGSQGQISTSIKSYNYILLNLTQQQLRAFLWKFTVSHWQRFPIFFPCCVFEHRRKQHTRGGFGGGGHLKSFIAFSASQNKNFSRHRGMENVHAVCVTSWSAGCTMTSNPQFLLKLNPEFHWVKKQPLIMWSFSGRKAKGHTGCGWALSRL